MFWIMWCLSGWIILLIVIKHWGSLSSMLSLGIEQIRKKDIERQQETGFSTVFIGIYFIALVVIYGFLGPCSSLVLLSLPAKTVEGT